MIRLPNISSLPQEKLNDYLSRVSAWLSGDRSDLNEGVLLCTAIPQARVFVDYANAYSADKRRSEIVKYLTPLCKDSLRPAATSPVMGSTLASGQGAQDSKSNHTLPITGEVPHLRRRGSSSSFTTSAGTVYTFSSDGTVTAVGGNRPSHFDEWLDRMPAELQDKIFTLKENFDNLVEYCRKVESLAADPNHSKTELSRYARLAVAYEARNLNIFAQADICWDELCGRAVSPDLKRELAQEESKLLKDIKKEEGSAYAPSPSAPSSPSPSQSVPVNNDAIVSPTPSDSSDSTELTDDQLSSMPIADLMALSSDILPDGPRRYWLKRRCDQAQKYLRDKLPDSPSPSQREKAVQYARDILAINGKLSKKVSAKLDSLGIALNLPCS